MFVVWNSIEHMLIKGIDDASHSLFVKAKCDIKMLAPTHYALE